MDLLLVLYKESKDISWLPSYPIDIIDSIVSYQIVQVDFCGYLVHPCETDTFCFHFYAIMKLKPVRT